MALPCSKVKQKTQKLYWIDFLYFIIQVSVGGNTKKEWRKNEKPKKNKKGNRLFTKDDIENFHLIYYLVKEQGMTLVGAQKRIKENKEGTVNTFDIVKTLTGIREMLLEVKETL